jgi:hypothetical protein
MANQEHLDLLKQGVETWNQWRQEHPDVTPDLSGADLGFADLLRADFRYTDLSSAELGGADLSFAVLVGANLKGANLSGVDLVRADLTGANLSAAIFIEANLQQASLSNCIVHGISLWDVEVTGARQDNLVISRADQASITVDQLNVAQFLSLWLTNEQWREGIDLKVNNTVFLLGRFPAERQAVLDILRDILRQHGYCPIVLDLEPEASGSSTETTLKALAPLVKFMIADLTGWSTVPQAVQAIAPRLAIPVQALLFAEDKAAALSVEVIKTAHGALPVYVYNDQAGLQTALKEQLIAVGEQTARTPFLAVMQRE